MHCVRKVTEDLYWVGSNDRRLELFENIFPIQKGVSYNSYLLLDEKTVLLGDKKIIIKEGETFSCGKHTLHFVMAPMVHWPEAMMTYDETDKVLFSADAFGTFGALDGVIFNDEMDFDRDYLDEARRYYTNIVGKYGIQVQNVLKKAAALDIQMICPLHGPVWRSNLSYILEKYDIWSKYEAETKGVMIAYASMYGNTENMVNVLAAMLADAGITNIKIHNISKTHVSELISDSFKYSHLVLAAPTYNNGIYPLMANYLEDMKALMVQGRTVAVLGNGSWAPQSAKLMEAKLAELKNMTLLTENFAVKSALHDSQMEQLQELCTKITDSVNA